MKFLLLSVLVFAFALPGVAFAHYEGELLPDSVAVMEYSMVISMAPRDTLTRNKLGMVYIRQKDYVKARGQFGEILKIDPKNFDALDSLGIVSDSEGKYAEAADWYGRALKARPGDAGAKGRLDAAQEKSRAKQVK